MWVAKTSQWTLTNLQGVFFTLPKGFYEIKASWVKIFDMDYCPKYSASPFDKKSIQATWGSLSVDEFIKVDEFVAK